MPSSVSVDSTQSFGDPFAGSVFSAVERLGAGAMGEVYRVLHRELGREFVAKVLHQRFAADQQMLERVRVEAQALGRLNHPNVVSVTGFGVTRDGRPFLVMEYLRGRTLAAEIAARGALPAREAIRFTLELLAALEAAHALGIVHRDIKPDNLFIAENADGMRRLQVLDFGLARVMPGVASAAPKPLALPTSTGNVIGTPHFVSPEGALGKKVDARADLYSAGLVLYALLAGRGPFDRIKRVSRILTAQASMKPKAPSIFGGRSLPPALDELVLLALRKDPNERFQNARVFACALAEISLDDLPPTPDGSAAQRARAFFWSLQLKLREGLDARPWIVFAVVVLLTATTAARLMRLLLGGAR
ncbi:MAG TPA: serine/threonine-protein kinase [Polyangiaceae bacterium]|nr:serine/threonine-protein kinase [Polyangiaceae bacterium]